MREEWTERVRRRSRVAGPGSWAPVDTDSIDWQKEILWMTIKKRVVDVSDLARELEEAGAGDVWGEIEAMLEDGYLEEINGYLRVHPNFAENCYAHIS